MVLPTFCTEEVGLGSAILSRLAWLFPQGFGAVYPDLLPPSTRNSVACRLIASSRSQTVVRKCCWLVSGFGHRAAGLRRRVRAPLAQTTASGTAAAQHQGQGRADGRGHGRPGLRHLAQLREQGDYATALDWVGLGSQPLGIGRRPRRPRRSRRCAGLVWSGVWTFGLGTGHLGWGLDIWAGVWSSGPWSLTTPTQAFSPLWLRRRVKCAPLSWAATGPLSLAPRTRRSRRRTCRT